MTSTTHVVARRITSTIVASQFSPSQRTSVPTRPNPPPKRTHRLRYLEQQYDLARDIRDRPRASMATILGDVEIDHEDHDLRFQFSCDFLKGPRKDTRESGLTDRQRRALKKHRSQANRGWDEVKHGGAKRPRDHQLCRCSCSRVLILSAVSNLMSSYVGRAKTSPPGPPCNPHPPHTRTTIPPHSTTTHTHNHPTPPPPDPPH